MSELPEPPQLVELEVPPEPDTTDDPVEGEQTVVDERAPLPPGQIVTPVVSGLGFTVTIIDAGIELQLPGLIGVGVTIYSTVPGVLPGLRSIWLITGPDPGLAPEIPPVIAPIVHE